MRALGIRPARPQEQAGSKRLKSACSLHEIEGRRSAAARKDPRARTDLEVGHWRQVTALAVKGIPWFHLVAARWTGVHGAGEQASAPDKADRVL